jgi:TonB family protein
VATSSIYLGTKTSDRSQSPSGLGSGSGTGSGIGSGPAPAAQDDASNIRLLSKPRPTYTDEARQNGTEGTVRLRVTFLSTGEVGTVQAMTSLPDGLTERAIEAAKQIQFEPSRVNGTPVTITKQIEYTFSIY